MEKCLVCGKKKITNKVYICKLCGMGLDEDNYIKENNSIFCCTRCSKAFKTILENVNEKEKQDLLKKNIIF